MRLRFLKFNSGIVQIVTVVAGYSGLYIYKEGEVEHFKYPHPPSPYKAHIGDRGLLDEVQCHATWRGAIKRTRCQT